MIRLLVGLFWSFVQIGLLSIGGGYATIPLIEEQMVQQHRWLTIQEFTDIITISQMTPGPLAVNTSTFVGIRIAGIPGAIVATGGCIVGGCFLSILLYRFFQRNREAESAVQVLKGLRACSVGLIGASAVTILRIAFLGTGSWDMLGIGVNVGAFVVFGLSLFGLMRYKMNPMLVMVLTGVVGVFLYGY